MKNYVYRVLTICLLVLFTYSNAVFAGPLTLPTPTFTDGEILTSTQLEGNFTEIDTQVDDNDLRINNITPQLQFLNSFSVISDSADPLLRIVRGTINALGGIGSGGGFTISNTATGVYLITFDQPFTTGVTVTANTWTINGYIRVSLVGADSCTLLVLNNTGAPTNAGFHFMAIGGD